MLERRRDNQTTTPEYEDSGIFKGPMTNLLVRVTPKISKNGRGDVVIGGFADNNVEIEVVFAGRRKATVNALITVLKQRWTMAVKASEGTGATPSPDNVRFPINVRGAWRPRFESDDQGWMSRSYQLMVAQWSMTDPQGNAQHFGEPPLGYRPPAQSAKAKTVGANRS